MSPAPLFFLSGTILLSLFLRPTSPSSRVTCCRRLSTVRTFDPECEANLLLQHTFALNVVVHETMVIASDILCASVQSLMRHVWNTAGPITIHERDLTIGVFQEAVVRIQDLTDESFLHTLTSLKTHFPGDRADRLQAFWDLAVTRTPKGRSALIMPA